MNEFHCECPFHPAQKVEKRGVQWLNEFHWPCHEWRQIGGCGVGDGAWVEIGGVVIGGVVIGGVVIGILVIGILVIGILVIGILVSGGVVIFTRHSLGQGGCAKV